MQRVAYIDRRLRFKNDFPACPQLARDYDEEYGESISYKTFARDID